eukprot:6198790-Pleurochrysis_carterae.AAC.2
MQLAWSCERRLEHSAPIGLASGDVVAGDDHLAARVLHGHLGAGVAMRLEQLGDWRGAQRKRWGEQELGDDGI